MKRSESNADDGDPSPSPSSSSPPSSSRNNNKKKSKKKRKRVREEADDEEGEGPKRRTRAEASAASEEGDEQLKKKEHPGAFCATKDDCGAVAGRMGSERRRRKRRRSRGRGGGDGFREGDDDDGRGSTSSRPISTADGDAHSLPLGGITVSVSTVDRDAQRRQRDGVSVDTDHRRHRRMAKNSYKSVCRECRDLGATVSAQVHRRVSYVVCNVSAVHPTPTQRIRRAVRLGIDVVDVAWIRECAERGELVDPSPHLLNDDAREAVVVAKATAAASASTKSVEGGDDDGAGLALVDGEEADGAAGWSSPVELDCCCVCHENGHDDCEWCRSCSVNLAKREGKRKQEGMK